MESSQGTVVSSPRLSFFSSANDSLVFMSAVGKVKTQLSRRQERSRKLPWGKYSVGGHRMGVKGKLMSGILL